MYSGLGYHISIISTGLGNQIGNQNPKLHQHCNVTYVQNYLKTKYNSNFFFISGNEQHEKLISIQK